MFRASALTVFVSLVLALVSLANTSVTARALGLEGRGLLASALLVVALARGVSLLGLGEAFVFQSRNNRLRGDGCRYLNAAFWLVVLAGLCVAAVLLPFGPLLAVLAVSILTVVLGGVGSGYDFLVASARYEPELRAFNWLRLLAPSLGTLSLILVWAVMPVDVGMVLSLQIGSTAVAIVLGYAAIRRMLRKREVHVKEPSLSVPRFLRSGMGYQGIAVLGLVITHAHMYVVMLIGSLAAFGLYSSAFGLSRMVAPVQMSIGSAVFAFSVGSNDEERGAAALRAFRVTFLPLLLVAGLIASMSPWVIRVLLGAEFEAASHAFAILTVEAVVGGGAFVLGQHLQAVGRVRSVMARNALSIFPILTGAIWLDSSNVVLGMATLMLLASVIRLVATLAAFQSRFGLQAWRVFPSGADCKVLINLLRGAR